LDAALRIRMLVTKAYNTTSSWFCRPQT